MKVIYHQYSLVPNMGKTYSLILHHESIMVCCAHKYEDIAAFFFVNNHVFKEYGFLLTYTQFEGVPHDYA